MSDEIIRKIWQIKNAVDRENVGTVSQQEIRDYAEFWRMIDELF